MTSSSSSNNVARYFKMAEGRNFISYLSTNTLGEEVVRIDFENDDFIEISDSQFEVKSYGRSKIYSIDSDKDVEDLYDELEEYFRMPDNRSIM